jgi:MIP family channel proteins
MRNLGRRALAEGIGTFFWVLLGVGALMVDEVTHGSAIGPVGVAICFAFVVLAMVYALGRVSGAHLNPAVTLALWSRHRFPARAVPAYLVAQCAGAVLATLILRWIVGDVARMGASVPAVPVVQSFVIEFLASFAIMLVIMGVATDRRAARGASGAAVGLTVGLATLVASPLTGASMNPARSLGPAVVGSVWTMQWLYWAAPILGMMAAAWTFDFVRPANAPGAVPPGVPLGLQGPLDNA